MNVVYVCVAACKKCYELRLQGRSSAVRGAQRQAESTDIWLWKYKWNRKKNLLVMPGVKAGKGSAKDKKKEMLKL